MNSFALVIPGRPGAEYSARNHRKPQTFRERPPYNEYTTKALQIPCNEATSRAAKNPEIKRAP